MLSRRAVLGAGLAAVAVPALGAAATPAQPSIVRLSPELDRVLDWQTPIETIASGIKWAEGPVWVPRDGGYLLFSDPPANVIRRWSRRGGVGTFLAPSDLPNPDPATVREGGSNGLALDRDGNLLIAGSGSRALVKVDLATGKRTVLVDRYRGKRFNSLNDLCVRRDGAVYFTDPPYGLVGLEQSPLRKLPFAGVYRWVPGGEAVLIDDSLARPNGIALSRDGKRLFVSVSEKAAPRTMVYDLDRHGVPTARALWFDGTALGRANGFGSADGMKIASDGTHFSSMPGGMMILSAAAEPLGQIRTGAPIANCAFGEDGRTLFLTANDRVLRLRMKVFAL